ncbi:hypothetical protein [Pedobacter agri]|uniref:hypothetical protein n=1 Tax=Pedobacter agri TaxID=454586 RepID=UPI002931E374|nr:hypothetical protein [Pedobacter agri]
MTEKAFVEEQTTTPVVRKSSEENITEFEAQFTQAGSGEINNFQNNSIVTWFLYQSSTYDGATSGRGMLIHNPGRLVRLEPCRNAGLSIYNAKRPLKGASHIINLGRSNASLR